MAEEEEAPFCEKCVRKVPLLSSDHDTVYDIVIIGGGLGGCWTAYWLTRRAPKSKIAVVEKRPDIREGAGWGSSASMVNAGSLSGDYDGEGVSRETFLEVARAKGMSFGRRIMGKRVEEKIFGRSSSLRYDDIGIGMPNSIFSFHFLCSFFRNCFFPSSRDQENFSYSRFFQNIEAKSIERYRDLSEEMKGSLGATFSIYSGRMISAENSKKSQSNLSPQIGRWLSDFLHNEIFPEDISLNTDRFLRIFHTYLMKRNVAFFYDTDVTEICVSNQQVVGLKTSRGNLVATSMYVFCTGANFHPIMNRWASPGWGLCREYRYISNKDETLLVSNTTTVESPHYLYVVPRGKTGIRVTSGFFLSPSPPSDSQLRTFVKSIDLRTKDALSPSVMENLQLSSQSVQYGGRPVCPDGRPVIGAHPDLRNAFVMNGLGMYGHASAEFSRMLCDMMTGRLNEVERNYGCSPDILSPSRFKFGDYAIKWMNKWANFMKRENK